MVEAGTITRRSRYDILLKKRFEWKPMKERGETERLARSAVRLGMHINARMNVTGGSLRGPLPSLFRETSTCSCCRFKSRECAAST